MTSHSVSHSDSYCACLNIKILLSNKKQRSCRKLKFKLGNLYEKEISLKDIESKFKFSGHCNRVSEQPTDSNKLFWNIFRILEIYDV